MLLDGCVVCVAYQLGVGRGQPVASFLIARGFVYRFPNQLGYLTPFLSFFFGFPVVCI